jgi:hypothetical protein
MAPSIRAASASSASTPGGTGRLLNGLRLVRRGREGDDRSALVLTAGWSSRWMTRWKVAGREVTCPVAGMGGFPVPGCEPVRHFTWRICEARRWRSGVGGIPERGGWALCALAVKPEPGRDST